MAIQTIKFSQFASGGNLSNDNITVGLNAGTNAQFNNPWTFLPPGTTAQRPINPFTVAYQLRLNTDLQHYEYFDPIATAWIQLNNAADNFTWNNVITATQIMISANGYVINYSGGLCTLTLPALSAIGDEIAIAGVSAGGWALAQGAGQSIIIAPAQSTVGVTGSIVSEMANCSIQLVCVTANLTWEALSGPQGIIGIN